jgi:hypothetical protein
MQEKNAPKRKIFAVGQPNFRTTRFDVDLRVAPERRTASARTYFANRFGQKRRLSSGAEAWIMRSKSGGSSDTRAAQTPVLPVLNCLVPQFIFIFLPGESSA